MLQRPQLFFSSRDRGRRPSLTLLPFLWTAGDNAKPISSVKTGVDSPIRSILANHSTLGSPTRANKSKAKPGAFVPDKAQAFEEYKETDGAQLAGILKDNQLALKDKKVVQRNLAMTINTLKKEIDELKMALEDKRNQVCLRACMSFCFFCFDWLID